MKSEVVAAVLLSAGRSMSIARARLRARVATNPITCRLRRIEEKLGASRFVFLASVERHQCRFYESSMRKSVSTSDSRFAVCLLFTFASRKVAREPKEKVCELNLHLFAFYASRNLNF